MSQTEDDAAFNQMVELNEEYNKLALLQQKLPNRRPNYDTYAAIEKAVWEQAQAIIYLALAIRPNGTLRDSAVDNIMDGCVQVRANPYKKLARVAIIPPRR